MIVASRRAQLRGWGCVCPEVKKEMRREPVDRLFSLVI